MKGLKLDHQGILVEKYIIIWNGHCNSYVKLHTNGMSIRAKGNLCIIANNKKPFYEINHMETKYCRFWNFKIWSSRYFHWKLHCHIKWLWNIYKALYKWHVHLSWRNLETWRQTLAEKKAHSLEGVYYNVNEIRW